MTILSVTGILKINHANLKFCAIFIDGMVNIDIINENIIQPVVSNISLKEKGNLIDVIKKQVIADNDITDNGS